MTAFVPTQLGVMLPSDINDLAAAGIADGEFAKRVGGAWAGAKAVENLFDPVYDIVVFGGKNLSIGNNILTPDIPANCKLQVASWMRSNPTTSSNTNTLYHRRGSQDYVLYPTIPLGARAAAVFSSGPLAIMEPGDALNWNCSIAGCALQALGYVISTTEKVKCFSTVLVNGDNTIYTCPAGKKARVAGMWAIVPGTISYCNSSGGTRIYSLYVVPSGQVVGANYLLTQHSVSNGLNPVTQLFTYLVAGDSLVVNTDGAGAQMVQVSLYEEDV